MSGTSFFSGTPDTTWVPQDAPSTSGLSGDARSSFFTSGPAYAAINETAFYLNVSVGGAPFGVSEWLFGHVLDTKVTFPKDFTGSIAVSRVAATGVAVLSVRKNGVEFGTITFTGTSGTFSTSSDTVFAIGDVLELYAPATQDPTLQHVLLTLFAALTV